MTSYIYNSPKLEKMKPECDTYTTVCSSPNHGTYYRTYLSKDTHNNTNLITFSQPDQFEHLFYNTTVEPRTIPSGNGAVYNYKLPDTPCMYSSYENEKCRTRSTYPDCDMSIQDNMELHYRNLNYKHILQNLPQHESTPSRKYCN